MFRKYMMGALVAAGLLILPSAQVQAEDTVNLIYDGKVQAYTNTDIKIAVDGSEVVYDGMFPVIIDGRTLVPLREVLENEAIGAEVLWFGSEQKVVVQKGPKAVEIWIGRRGAIVDGEEEALEVPARLIQIEGNDYAKTMVPIRFIAEAMDYEVGWDGETQQVILTQNIIEEVQEPKEDVNVPDKKEEDKQPVTEGSSGEGSSDQEAEEVDEDAYLTWDRSKTAIKLERDAATGHFETFESEASNKTTTVANVLYYEYHDHYKVVTSDAMSTVEAFLWDGKLVIDIENALIGSMEKEIDVFKNEYVKNVRSSQFSLDPITSRVVFDLVDGASPSAVILNDDRTMLDVVFGSDGLTGIEIGSVDGFDYVDIKGDIGDINTFTLKDPNRLIIDLEDTQNPFGYNSYEGFRSHRLEEIKVAQFNERTTRIVIETGGIPQYKTLESGGITRVVLSDREPDALKVEKPKNPEFLTTATLTLGAIDDLEDVEITYDHINKKTIMTFSDDVGSLVNYDDDRIYDLTVKDNVITILSNRIYEYKPVLGDGQLVLKSCRPYDLYETIVVIDAGHGAKEAPGAVYNGVMEKDLNLTITGYIEDLVADSREIRYYFTRTRDVNTSFADRCELANDLNADLFLSVHNNAMDIKRYPHRVEVNGLEAHITEGEEQSPTEKALGNAFLKAVEDVDGLSARGLKIRDGLYVLNNTYMTSVLIEYGYMTNPQDFAFLTNNSNLEKLAVMTVEVIEDFVGD